MKVFEPIATTQNLTIIPRFNSVSVEVFIRSKEEETTTQLIETSTYIDGYMTIPVAYDFKENFNYDVRVTDGADIIWRGEIFVTSQADIQNYKQNKNEIILT